MAIIQIPEKQKLPTHFGCVNCGKNIPASEAVAGLMGTRGEQYFACNGHFWNPHQFISGWADVLAKERTAHASNQFRRDYEEVVDARTIH